MSGAVQGFVPFSFAQEELLTFFACLVRFSVLVAVLPVFGDRFVPAPVKVLFSVAISVVLYPALVKSGVIRPGEAMVWGATAFGIVGTVVIEAVCGLVLGFTAKLAFDAINMGANLVGNFIGFSQASVYDPHQETQTQTVAEVQMAIAMLMFLALDGHHMMLQTALDSYRVVGLGHAAFGALFGQAWISMTGEVIRFGIQIAAPIAVCLFAVNVAFGVMAKSIPQMNVLVLSFAVTTLMGMIILFLGVPQFASVSGSIFERMGDWMRNVMGVMAHG